MTKGKFKERYKDKHETVKEYMGFVANSLIDKYSEIPDNFIISLDLLATNLEIMVKSSEEISKDNGMVDKDKYHGQKKSAPLQTYFQAQGYVNNILSNFGLTPMSKSKMKQNTQEINVDDFLQNLTA